MAVPEITTAELVRAAEAGKKLQLLDIRAPERLASGYIDVLPEEQFFNIPGSQLGATPDLTVIGINRSDPLAVVCARGISSQGATAFLNQQGFDARSVVGGMTAWMSTLIPRALTPPMGFERLVQFDRMGKGSLAYLLVSKGKALVIDPPRQLQPILNKAKELGAKITGVADTHIHADYISGAPLLSAHLGIPYYLHPSDNSYPYDGTPGRLDIEPVSDGGEVAVGDASLTVWHNPGHTEGSASFVAGNTAFTGDFIFVNSLGRPDLGGKVEEWAKALWNSLERARGSWPQDFRICPAHYSSDAERESDRSVGRTLEAVLATNEPASKADETDFIEWVVSRKSNFPDAYRTIKAINIGIAQVSPEEEDVLEMGKNECAVG
jgi:glyoxylase-like metal-dependent hydrolase (beta-lactamase superfamily II)